jgi:hypothetical protein
MISFNKGKTGSGLSGLASGLSKYVGSQPKTVSISQTGPAPDDSTAEDNAYVEPVPEMYDLPDGQTWTSLVRSTHGYVPQLETPRGKAGVDWDALDWSGVNPETLTWGEAWDRHLKQSGIYDNWKPSYQDRYNYGNASELHPEVSWEKDSFNPTFEDWHNRKQSEGFAYDRDRKPSWDMAPVPDSSPQGIGADQDHGYKLPEVPVYQHADGEDWNTVMDRLSGWTSTPTSNNANFRPSSRVDYNQLDWTGVDPAKATYAMGTARYLDSLGISRHDYSPKFQAQLGEESADMVYRDGFGKPSWDMAAGGPITEEMSMNQPEDNDDLTQAAIMILQGYDEFSPGEEAGILEAFEAQFGPGSLEELKDEVSQAEKKFAQGGYVSDGMSDSIPAVIGGVQPAALSQGEYVVPADVVSGLGNGDTSAGIAQLSDMSDTVRKQRTGKESQPKAINSRGILGIG